MDLKQHYTFQIRAYEISPNGQVTMATICNYLQESAGLHADELNVSSPKINKQGLTWVLARLHVKMHKFPGWLDEIKITTWPAQIERLYTIRDFMLEHNGDEIGVATSAWVLIDLQTRRPVRRIPEEIVAVHPGKPVRSLDDPFQKLSTVSDSIHTNKFPIRSQDLDMNSHVNNVVFISLLQDNLPQSQQSGHSIYQLEIDFRGEAFAGDVLFGFCEPSNEADEYIHSFTRNEDGPEIIRAKTKLKKF